MVVQAPDDITTASSSSRSTQRTSSNSDNLSTKWETTWGTASTSKLGQRRRVAFNMSRNKHYANCNYSLKDLVRFHLWYTPLELRMIKMEKTATVKACLAKQKQQELDPVHQDQEDQSNEPSSPNRISCGEAMDVLYKMGFTSVIDANNITSFVDPSRLRTIAQTSKNDNGETLGDDAIEHYVGLERHVVESRRRDRPSRRRVLLQAVIGLQAQQRANLLRNVEFYLEEDEDDDEEDDDEEALRHVSEEITRVSKVFARVLGEAYHE